MHSYASLCDDFGVSTYIHGKLEMPSGRETVLHFFEALQRVSPKMTEFEKRSDTEYMLEEERDSGNYRWASLDHRRLSAGFVNPPTLEDADAHNERVLEMAAGHLDLGPLQTESMDVLYYFDFLYQGNHDEVVAEALTTGTPHESLIQVPAARVLGSGQLLDHAQLTHRAFFEQIEHPVAGTHPVPGLPFKISDRSVRWNRSPAPTLGQHTAATLSDWLGYDDSMLAELEELGVTGTRPSSTLSQGAS